MIPPPYVLIPCSPENASPTILLRVTNRALFLCHLCTTARAFIHAYRDTHPRTCLKRKGRSLGLRVARDYHQTFSGVGACCTPAQTGTRPARPTQPSSTTFCQPPALSSWPRCPLHTRPLDPLAPFQAPTANSDPNFSVGTTPPPWRSKKQNSRLSLAKPRLFPPRAPHRPLQFFWSLLAASSFWGKNKI